MSRKLLIGTAALLLLATAAAPAVQAQQGKRQVELERLHAQCDQNYKPACIRFGFIIGESRNRQQDWRREHPNWFWWERW